MEMIKVIINDKEISCYEGESILSVARAHDVFIPAICYLSCASPTLACKMCMVEADGKRVYACNAKVKDGMKVIVNTPEIEEERRAIMQTYDVNHPLQCGVCDKSGECELQNYTHYVGVREQNYALRDEYKEFKSWGAAVYDPNLCIVCERCVTLCKDKIGKAHIKALKFDGQMPAKEYKDSMPKDAFGVWSKAKKSLIGLNGVSSDACGDCGECVSVCPVGALSIAHFQYRSNAWELEKINSSCVHCANGCGLTYEVKQKDICANTKEVYRVTSDWNFSTLCPAGRLAFSFNNQHIKKDELAFNQSIAAFKEAQSIRFSGNITNEEALILQQLKEKYGYKLICDSVYNFKEFLQNFSNIALSFGKANQKQITQSSFVLCFGGALSYDMPVITHSINNAMKLNKGANLAYFHTLKDIVVNDFSKNAISGIYKAGSEEAMALILASICIEASKMPKCIKDELNKFAKTEKIIQKSTDENGAESLQEVEMQSSALYEYCGINREIIESTKDGLKNAKNPILIIGFDVYDAKNASNIAKILGAIEAYSEVKILLLPPTTNALGISLICDLQKEAQGYCIGYNASGNYKIGYEAHNSLITPFLSEQEGTFVNVDKRVIPISPATPFYGYCLNDIAKALGLEKEYTIDYTQELPLDKGFKSVLYDDLEYGFSNDGTEIRGYLLDTHINAKESLNLTPIELNALESYNLYARNSAAHFSKQTLDSKLLKSKNGLQLGKDLAQKLGISEDSKVLLSFKDGGELEVNAQIDEKTEGELMALGVCGFSDEQLRAIFPNTRYVEVKFKVLV